jgi:hypothetical protein
MTIERAVIGMHAERNNVARSVSRRRIVHLKVALAPLPSLPSVAAQP